MTDKFTDKDVAQHALRKMIDEQRRTQMPTDNEILKGAALAIGLEVRYTDAGDGEGYFTVPAAIKGIRTTWNPLRQPSQSQMLQARMEMATHMHADGHVEVAVRMGSEVHMVAVQPQPDGPEATLRRAIAHAAYLANLRPADSP